MRKYDRNLPDDFRHHHFDRKSVERRVLKHMNIGDID
jgi:hypothetical protein